MLDIIVLICAAYIVYKTYVHSARKTRLTPTPMADKDPDHLSLLSRCNANRACALRMIEQSVESMYYTHPEIQKELDLILFYTRIDAYNPDWEYKNVIGEVWNDDNPIPPSLRKNDA